MTLVSQQHDESRDRSTRPDAVLRQMHYEAVTGRLPLRRRLMKLGLLTLYDEYTQQQPSC